MTPSPLPPLPEILRQICEHLVSHRTSLVSLASTCKMFEEPALDVLWSELDGFYPLAKCLPSHLWNEEPREGNRIYMVFKLLQKGDIDLTSSQVLAQPLSPVDCSRLLIHARRVQNFAADCRQGVSNSKRVDVSIYQAVQVATQSTKLLPNVRKILWNGRHDSFSFIHMFLGPHLTNVNLVISPKHSTHLSLVPALCEHHPSLKFVTLRWAAGASDIMQKKGIAHISNLVYKWNNLQYLDVPSLTYPALVKLSEIPHLKALYLAECTFDDATYPVSQEDGFPVLKDLQLRGCGSTSSCISVLALMDDSPVEYLLLTFSGIESSASWGKVFLAVSEHCNHYELTQVEFRDGTGRGNNIFIPDPSQMIEDEALQPLLAFHELSWITIEPTAGFKFSDLSKVEELMLSWVNAQELTIKMPPFSRRELPPTITLLDMIKCVKNAGDLEQLGLVFDATSPPTIDPKDTSLIRSPITSISELLVGDSPIENPNLVAAALSGIFPSLKRITTIEDEELLLQPRDTEYGSHHKLWKQTEELLEVFSAVRDQARQHAKELATEEESAREYVNKRMAELLQD